MTKRYRAVAGLDAEWEFSAEEGEDLQQAALESVPSNLSEADAVSVQELAVEPIAG